ncbi:CDGSH iron-sulfur domain-containing protein [Aldersonia kunmingensis]|uniref:CDGSH iron-sulfur domain-containing protein n=1 Tax=Aldersonia kunmingensis TaxID=408066 RepID=UPI00082A281B|nr:CDGSH iron-sulfur domain-containing protein [Aldersonia kunmingensis]
MPTGPTDRTEPNARRVRPVKGGPVLIDGPVEVELPDGSVVSSDRFVVALCVCRRSRTYPLCDTSHRRKCRAVATPGDDE